jgi:hypothetical protein
MYKTLVLFFFLLAICFHGLLAQQDSSSYRSLLDKDKERFEHILNRETRSIQADPDDKHKYYLIPDELPEWFFKPSAYASASKYMIGISDPGLDSAKAMKSATLRAKGLLLMAERMQVENLSDNFNVSREFSSEIDQNSQYIDFARITAKGAINTANFTIEKQFYTKYGEGIVLISYKSKLENEQEFILVNGELMQLAREDNISLDNTALCKFTVYSGSKCNDRNSDSTHYIYKAKDNRFNIISTLEGDTIDFPVHPYRYLSSRDSLEHKKNSFQHGISAGNGLWNAFINSLLSQLTYHNKYLESKVKTTYDNYNAKNQGIIRTVSRNYLDFSLSGMDIIDQRLFLDVKFQEQEGKK